MDHQTGAKLRFEPRRLRRHDITRIGDIHQLLHRNGIQSQGNLHLTAIHPFLQFAQTAYTAHKVDTLIGTKVLDAEDFIQYQVCLLYTSDAADEL